MRSEPSHQSELVSQLLYGDCFKIISKKKGWLQITGLADQYSGWIDEKQAKLISKSDAEEIALKSPLFSNRLVDYIETPDHELTALVLGSNVGACKWLGHQYEGPTQSKKMDKSNLLKTASLYLNAPYL